jgi:succinate dehydrogenase / fumarate reductase membrane anchor subunit
METRLGRVRGHGSAKHGAGHWWHQRVTAAANLALVIWFLVTLFRLPALDYATVTEWLSQPLPAILLILLTISVFWHFRLGLQVVIEDYVHDKGLLAGCLILLNFYAIGGAAIAIFCILKIAFTGAAGA